MDLRRIALAIGGVGAVVGVFSLVSCGNKRPAGETSIINITPIPAPDSAEIWAVEVVGCIRRGSPPAGVKWYAASMPRYPEPLGGMADIAANSITLDYAVVTGPAYQYRIVVRHELAHLAVGWKANHPGIPPTGRVDHTEPRSIFNARCGTGF